MDRWMDGCMDGLMDGFYEILVSPEFFGLAARKHSKMYFKSPPDPTLFVAHIGILNVIVDVESVMPSLTHSIDPEGGVYIVPSESERNYLLFYTDIHNYS